MMHVYTKLEVQYIYSLIPWEKLSPDSVNTFFTKRVVSMLSHQKQVYLQLQPNYIEIKMHLLIKDYRDYTVRSNSIMELTRDEKVRKSNSTSINTFGFLVSYQS